MPDLDDRDRELIAARVEARHRLSEPLEGDWVEFADGISRRISYVWETSVQSSIGGSFHLAASGRMSHSGSLFTGAPLDTFTDSGELRDASAWIFHHDHRQAGNGVDTVVPVRVWRSTAVAPD